MKSDTPSFESYVQRFADGLKGSLPDRARTAAYSVTEKKLPANHKFRGRLDTALRDQGIVYVHGEDGLSVALSVRRFPVLSSIENKAYIEFQVNQSGAVCEVSHVPEDAVAKAPPKARPFSLF